MTTSASETKDDVSDLKALLEGIVDVDGITKEEKIQRTFFQMARLYTKDGTSDSLPVLCLECGYNGAMPIAGKKNRSETGGFLDGIGLLIAVLFLLLGYPIFLAFFLFLRIEDYLKGEHKKVYVACPSCRKILGPIKRD